MGQLTSWQTNSDTATSWLSTANSTANSVLESLQSAQTLLLQASNEGVQDATTFQALGSQINGIVSNLTSLANTQFEGRAIFAGTSASPTAYDASGNYLGNADTPSVVIGPGQGAGQTVALSVPGTALFGAGGREHLFDAVHSRNGAAVGHAERDDDLERHDGTQLEHLDRAAGERRARQLIRGSVERDGNAHQPDYERPGESGELGRRQRRDRNDAAGERNHELPSSAVGSRPVATGHVGEVPCSVARETRSRQPSTVATHSYNSTRATPSAENAPE